MKEETEYILQYAFLFFSAPPFDQLCGQFKSVNKLINRILNFLTPRH